MPFFSKRALKLMLCALVVLFFSIAVQKAYAPPPPPPTPTYTVSAHGNTSYGVNRQGLSSFGYSIGNCAHCHEQHASINGSEPAPAGGSPTKYELFTGIGQSQNSRFCYNCHQDSGASVQNSMPAQYSYSYSAGGDATLTCPNDIMQAFQFFTDTCGAQGKLVWL